MTRHPSGMITAQHTAVHTPRAWAESATEYSCTAIGAPGARWSTSTATPGVAVGQVAHEVGGEQAVERALETLGRQRGVQVLGPRVHEPHGVRPRLLPGRASISADASTATIAGLRVGLDAAPPSRAPCRTRRRAGRAPAPPSGQAEAAGREAQVVVVAGVRADEAVVGRGVLVELGGDPRGRGRAVEAGARTGAQRPPGRRDERDTGRGEGEHGREAETRTRDHARILPGGVRSGASWWSEVRPLGSHSGVSRIEDVAILAFSASVDAALAPEVPRPAKLRAGLSRRSRSSPDRSEQPVAWARGGRPSPRRGRTGSQTRRSH